MAIQIDKGVPYPDKTPYTAKYPFRQMAVGDSFFTDDEKDRIASAASYAGSRNNLKFSVRRVDGGFRVWRVA